MGTSHNKPQYEDILREVRPQFLTLIEICDSFDQLGRLAVILDKLYPPNWFPGTHKELFLTMEKTARHLRDQVAGEVPLD